MLTIHIDQETIVKYGLQSLVEVYKKLNSLDDIVDLKEDNKLIEAKNYCIGDNIKSIGSKIMLNVSNEQPYDSSERTADRVKHIETINEILKKKKEFHIVILKSREEAVEYCYRITGDEDFLYPRIRNYEIVQMMLFNGVALCIEDTCPINGFRSGMKTKEEYVSWLYDNYIPESKEFNINDCDMWVYELLKEDFEAYLKTKEDV